MSFNPAALVTLAEKASAVADLISKVDTGKYVTEVETIFADVVKLTADLTTLEAQIAADAKAIEGK